MIRTVSLLPAATEMVSALGLLDDLVGVSHDCDFPAAVNTKPRVTHCEIHGKGFPSADVDRWVSEQLQTSGTLYTIDDRLLHDLSPDLILTQKLCDVCAPAYGSVRALADVLPSQPRVLNLEPRSLADVFQNILEVATAMGCPERGSDLCVGLKRRVSEVVQRVAGLPRPGVFVMEWTDPLYTAGHWTPELVRLAGGTPLLSAEGADSSRVTWETVREADPEVLVIACCGHDVARTLQDLPRLETLPGWDELRAVRDRRVYVVNGSAYFSRPGPRVVDTLEVLAGLLHPETGQKPTREQAITVY